MIRTEIFIFELQKNRFLKQIFRKEEKHKEMEEAKKKISDIWAEYPNKYGKFATITTELEKKITQNYRVINGKFELKNTLVKRTIKKKE